VIQQLAEKLLLPDAAAMAHQIKEPSQVTRKSNSETQKLLQSKSNRAHLIEKWKLQVNDRDIVDADIILQTFSVTLYTASSAMPQHALIVK
jgi:hypothetical protein